MNKRLNLLVVALLVLFVAMGAAGDSNFTNVVASGDITAGDDLTVTDDASVGGNLSVTGTSTFTGAADAVAAFTAGSVDSDAGIELTTFFDIDASTVISPTDGGIITPTGTFQLLSSAGTVTPTIAVNADAGTLLILTNTTDTTINIADSGTTMLSAAAALGQYDTLVLISDGTNWLELAVTDN